jgi:hypothetical protein
MSIFGQNQKALDDKNGFRDAIFERPFDSFKDLINVEKDFYTSTSEDLKLGNFQMDQVAYSFYKGQLYIIVIKTKGYTNSRGILKILQTAYGKGYQDNEYIESYSWFGKRVAMAYDENSPTNDATIFMWSVKLSDLKKLDEEKAAKEAARKL